MSINQELHQKYNLNEQQAELFDIIYNMEFEKLFINAEAGCGKSYVCCAIAHELAEAGFKVGMSAPTHEAKNVLLSKLPADTTVEVKTLHSALKRFAFRTQVGERGFASPSAEGIGTEYDFFFVDEGSMLSEREGKELMLIEPENCLLVIMGDPEQLKAVMQKQGRLWEKIPTFKLTQQMRQQGEAFELARACREKPIYPSQSVGNIEVLESAQEMEDRFVELVVKAERPTDYLFLAYTNKTVDRINERIHQRLYSTSEPYVLGQWIKLETNTKVFSRGSELQIFGIAQLASDEGKVCGYKSYELLVGRHEQSAMWITVISPDQKERFTKKLEALIEHAKVLVKNEDFKQLKAVNKEIKKLDEAFYNVASPFARTVHKAQGSSKKYCFVNSLELFKCPEKKAMTYVAYSRASETLTLIRIPNPLKVAAITLSKMLKQAKDYVGEKLYNKVYRQLKKTVAGFGLRQGDSHKELMLAKLLAL